MPIKEATKEDIAAMKQRLKEKKADLQMDSVVRMVSQSKHKDVKGVHKWLELYMRYIIRLLNEISDKHVRSEYSILECMMT